MGTWEMDDAAYSKVVINPTTDCSGETSSTSSERRRVLKEYLRANIE